MLCEEVSLPRKTLKVGTCQAVAGELSYGSYEGPKLPTGSADDLAVVIAQGRRDGPVLWLTANIHGNEVAGIVVLHRLLSGDLTRDLQGTIVCIPSLNPAGLRTNKRHPYYDDRDPNRTFPGVRRDTGEAREPTVYERLSSRLLEDIHASADYYVDLHCASILSIPYSIRDRVLYREESEKADAQALSDRLDEMVAAFGFPAVIEYRLKSYIAKELHRSTTGAALQELRLPAFTVELGAHTVADEHAVSAGVIGLRNLLRWAKMLPGAAEAMPPIPQFPSSQRFRREDGGYPSVTGIADYRIKPGDSVKNGTVIAQLRDLWGRPIQDGTVKVTADSWVLGIEDGILAYPGASLAHFAVAETSPVVEAWPDEVR
ncbi:MAG: deacylase [Candidatus Eremiobacter antarcticus]|nr:MAG: deacylase [Candidatus Eremiobacter sp. RRmetagenome_bin22]